MREQVWPFIGTEAIAGGYLTRRTLRSRFQLYRQNGKPVDGIVIHRDELPDDELCTLRGIAATRPARTAFDLGHRKGLTRSGSCRCARQRNTAGGHRRWRVDSEPPRRAWPGAVRPGPPAHGCGRGITPRNQDAALARAFGFAEAGNANPRSGPLELSVRTVGHGIPRVEGGDRIRRCAALDGSRAAHCRYRSPRRTFRVGLADRQGQQ